MQRVLSLYAKIAKPSRCCVSLWLGVQHLAVWLLGIENVFCQWFMYRKPHGNGESKYAESLRLGRFPHASHRRIPGSGKRSWTRWSTERDPMDKSVCGPNSVTFGSSIITTPLGWPELMMTFRSVGLTRETLD